MITAVMPAFNEEKTIGKVIEQTKKSVDNIIVVDDGSEDKTYNVARKTGVTVLRHVINMGLGFTLKTGCEKAIKDGADIIVTIDGDGQHDPNEISKLVGILKKGNFDIVFGTRMLDKNMPLTKKFGNWLINSSSRFLFKIDMNDTQSGFRAFKGTAWERLKWSSDGYAVSSEIIMNTAKNRLKFKEVTIRTIYGDKFKGTTPFDGIRIFMKMLWWWIK
jgi:glycosyltransferase involved in cell wall biosynthesis